MTIDDRMRTWLETVPALLQRLDVKHAPLVTHSAGTVYTPNTLFHYRSILDPNAPYVAFMDLCSTSACEGADIDSFMGIGPPLGRNSHYVPNQTSAQPT